MNRYYTRACNFYYGQNSRILINQKKTLPLNDRKDISFDNIQIISRNFSKKVSIHEINKLPNYLKKQVRKDLSNITKKVKSFLKIKFNKEIHLMGILNITPDSFSDGGKFNENIKASKHMFKLFKDGAKIVDIGGESTRPGSKAISEKEEWNRIKKTLKKIKKDHLISVDTRKSSIMKKSLSLGAHIINDVSGLSYDKETISLLKKTNAPFILHHSLGNPDVMQKNPKYKNVLLDIYDFFETKIRFLRTIGIKHNNIILDPGIGFGKNLKHNMSLLHNVSIFHSLGFPLLIGNSRKRFIKELSGNNDSKFRIGGTIASAIYLMMQGIQILRIHDVNETMQSIKVFKKIINN